MSDKKYLLWNRPESAKLYSSEDPSQKNPLLDQPKVQEHLENRLKASLQYFSQGLWDQKLYTPSR